MKIRNLLVLALFSLFLFTACNNQSSEKKESPKAVVKQEMKSQAQTIEKKEEPKEANAPAKTEVTAPAKLGQKFLLSTKFGDMTILLYDETPKHRDNFIKLVKEGYYNGTLFHRVMKDFMIQGGDPESKGAAPGVALGKGGPGYTIEAEFLPEFIHKKGALAAARQGDAANPQRRSSGSQFYIVQGKKVTAAELNSMAQRTGAFYTADQIETYQKIGGTPFLDNEYTVFGEVISGMEVIDKIAMVPTSKLNRPLEDIKMTIKLIEN